MPLVEILSLVFSNLDSHGLVVVRYVYDAWGNHKVLDSNGKTVTSGIGVLNPFRYRGYYYDTETGLYYLQTRYYDPEVGRFISQDSIEYADPTSINGLNLYAYCGNNPVMNVDPAGNAWWHWLITAVVAVAVVAAAVLTAGAIVAVAPAVAAAASYVAISLGASAGVASFVAGAVSVGATVLALSNIAIGINEAINIVSGYNMLSAFMGEDLYNGFRNTVGITSAIFITAGMNLPNPRTDYSEPQNLNEQVSRNLLKRYPDKGKIIEKVPMNDPRMPGWLGWRKYQFVYRDSAGNPIFTYHYVGNIFFPAFIRPYFDFKLKR